VPDLDLDVVEVVAMMVGSVLRLVLVHRRVHGTWIRHLLHRTKCDGASRYMNAVQWTRHQTAPLSPCGH